MPTLEMGVRHPDGTVDVLLVVHRDVVDGPITQIEFPEPAPKEEREDTCHT